MYSERINCEEGRGNEASTGWRGGAWVADRGGDGAGVPGSGSSTTTETSGPNGSSTTMTKQGTGWNGNAVTKQDTYKEGATGSSETNSKTETDPASDGTTTSKTTTSKPE